MYILDNQAVVWVVLLMLSIAFPTHVLYLFFLLSVVLWKKIWWTEYYYLKYMQRTHTNRVRNPTIYQHSLLNFTVYGTRRLPFEHYTAVNFVGTRTRTMENGQPYQQYSWIHWVCVLCCVKLFNIFSIVMIIIYAMDPLFNECRRIFTVKELYWIDCIDQEVHRIIITIA